MADPRLTLHEKLGGKVTTECYGKHWEYVYCDDADAVEVAGQLDELRIQYRRLAREVS